MSERYTKLFALSKDLYIDGSPVVISAGALLKDNDKDSVLVQLKFKSICRKVIKAVTVKIIPMDSAGRELGEKIEHKYLDISAKRNNEFAQKEPVYLSDNSTRAFSVYVSEVIFDDNSIWACDDAGWESLLDEEIRFGDNELFKQYRMTYGAYAGKQPVYMNSIWKCTCGYINNSDEDKCQNCNVEIGKLKAFDMEQMKADCSARLEKEEQARQEAKKKADEEQKRKEAEEAERQIIEAEKRKRYKKIGIISRVVAVCIGGVVVTNMVIIPDIKYNKAVSLIESESYDEAFALLEKLGPYKMYRYPKDYDEACSALESGSYSEAISLFKYLALADYGESKTLLLQAIYRNNSLTYENGLSLLESGAYDEAIECFESLGDFKDSSDMAKKSKMLSDFGKIEVGNTIKFGEHYWDILDITDNKALIISNKCLDYKKYGLDTWENCTLRKYLNKDFYNEFTDIEKLIILNTQLTNDDNSYTIDRVFILSLEEAEKYLTSAKKRSWDGIYVDWWLRTTASPGRACCVTEKGYISLKGIDTTSERGVCPAMWISLE